MDKTYRFLNNLLMIFSLIFLALITFVLGFIVPKFTALFEEFKVELPFLTHLIIRISSFVWILGLLLATLIVFLFRNAKFTNLLTKSAPLSYVISLILICVVLGILIGIIVIGVFLPIYKITSIVK